MKSKIIILLVLGLLFCINLNKYTPTKVDNKKNDNHASVINKNDVSQITSISDTQYENTVKVGIYTTPVLSFNVEPINSVIEANTSYSTITTESMVNYHNQLVITEKSIKVAKELKNTMTTYVSKYITIDTASYLLNKKYIIANRSFNFLQKTFVSVDVDNEKWRGCNIYLSQVTKKLGRT